MIFFFSFLYFLCGFFCTVTFGDVLLGYFALPLCEGAAVLMEGSHILFLSEPDTSSQQQNEDL